MDNTRRTYGGQKPDQRKTSQEKKQQNYAWYKDNADFYVRRSIFYTASSAATNRPGSTSLSPYRLHQLYNSQFPSDWFTSVINPYNSKKKEFQTWPAKIRPLNILRTNIDFLAGEWSRRPLRFDVINYGEEGYNSFTQQLADAVAQNIQQHFTQMVIQQALAAGLPVEEIPQVEQELELPPQIKERFASSYTDNMARFGRITVEKLLREHRVRRLYNKLFKDYLITGYAYSYKSIEHGLVYEAIGAEDIDYGKSPTVDFVEDAEWVVCRRWMTAADVVDKFYDIIKNDEENQWIERANIMSTPGTFYNFLNDAKIHRDGLIPVFHIQWKGRKRILVTHTVQPDGSIQEEIHDEDYPLPEGVKAEELWVNEGHEVWRIGEKIYANPRPIPNQRNLLTSRSVCKLSYNGVAFSDRYTTNVSPMELGLPYQMLFMITGFILEKTIAKSKGKILLLDKNTIPRTNGWTDEKFFYWADANGYALLDRSQVGVDKSMNTYQVLDMGLFDHIKELIGLQQYFKSEWDELLGITRQRKGQMMASDDVGNSQQAILQSSIITDTLVLNFEDFIETELQGVLDLARLAGEEGAWAEYNVTDFDREMLKVDREQFQSAQLGLHITRSNEEQEKLTLFRQLAMQLSQNSNTSVTMLYELAMARSTQEVGAKIKKLEELQQQMAQAAEQAKIKAETDADNRIAALEKLKADLQIAIDDNKAKRAQELELLKGDINLHSFNQDGDQNDNGIPDINEIYKRYLERDKLERDTSLKTSELAQKERMQTKELAQRERESQRKLEADKLKAKTALKNKVSGEK